MIKIFSLVNSKISKFFSTTKTLNIPDDILVVIASAISIANKDYHEEEEVMMTIEKVTKPYSPWFHSGLVRVIQQKANSFRRR